MIFIEINPKLNSYLCFRRDGSFSFLTFFVIIVSRIASSLGLNDSNQNTKLEIIFFLFKCEKNNSQIETGKIVIPKNRFNS